TPTVSLEVVNGAIRAHFSLDDVHIKGKLMREGGLILDDIIRDFALNVAHIGLDVDFKAISRAGKVDVSTQLVGSGISVSKPDFDGEGVIGKAGAAVADLVFSGKAKDEIEKAMRKAVDKDGPAAL